MHIEKYYIYMAHDDFASEADRLVRLEEDIPRFLKNRAEAIWSDCPSWFDETNPDQAKTILAAEGFKHTMENFGFISCTLAIIHCAGIHPPKIIYFLTEDGFKIF